MKRSKTPPGWLGVVESEGRIVERKVSVSEAEGEILTGRPSLLHRTYEKVVFFDVFSPFEVWSTSKKSQGILDL